MSYDDYELFLAGYDFEAIWHRQVTAKKNAHREKMQQASAKVNSIGREKEQLIASGLRRSQRMNNLLVRLHAAYLECDAIAASAPSHNRPD